jgi:hypothetical protein
LNERHNDKTAPLSWLRTAATSLRRPRGIQS